jgi:hypothetical protein
MVIFVKLFGILMAALGVIFLISPGVVKSYIAFWPKGKRIYFGAALSLLIGIIFLLAASQCRWSLFVIIIGIWALIKGLLLFILGQKRIVSWLNWWTARPMIVLRIYALIALVLGALLIYSA